MKSNDIHAVDSKGFSLDVVVRDSASNYSLESVV